MQPHNTTRRKYTTIANSFWTHCLKKGPNECWGWKAALHKGGYGLFGYNGKMHLAHRASWEIHFGPIPKGMFVLHKCDNPICTNPNHLFLGTQLDNMRDMFAKGRGKPGHHFGEKTGTSKLTETQVLEIRAKHASGQSTRSLMVEYNFSKSGIEHIVARRTWKHI